MKRCVINFASGSWFARGQARLKESFLSHGYDGDFLLYDDTSEFDCPPHNEMPYAFKPYMFQKAIDMGYQQIIWCDAAIFLANDKSLGRIYRQLDTNGYMLVLNGWNTGQWCSDAALPLLGITREESFKIPHIMANAMAFDVSSDRSKEFLRQYYEHAKDGSFRGAWTNEKNQVSNDPRVMGHRHDQTAGSVIAWRLGMTNLLTHWTTYDPQDPDPLIVFFTHPA